MNRFSALPMVAVALLAFAIPASPALGDEARVKEMLRADPRLLHSRTSDGFPGVGVAIFFRHGAS